MDGRATGYGVQVIQRLPRAGVNRAAVIGPGLPLIQIRLRQGARVQLRRRRGFHDVGRRFRQALTVETAPKRSGWWLSSNRPVDHTRKVRPFRSTYL
jgi:hypothetical protein